MNSGHPTPIHTPASQGAQRMTLVIAACVLVFIAWAALFDIDQTVRTQGQFIPSDHTQVIQAVDGGVLAKLLVREGQQVQAGQTLAELEPDRAQAAFDESATKVIALKAALLRAQAEANGLVPVFGAEFKAHPELVQVQTRLYAQRKQGLSEALASVAESAALAKEELAMNESLFATGDTSRAELLRAQRQVTELQARASELRNKYLQEASAEAARQAEELLTLSHRQTERQHILSHMALTAPLAGVVKNLRITTVGGVLRAGDELMQISPTEGELLLEVRINPADIGLLRLGQQATLRLDAFDYSIYGTLQGELIYLSSDTLVEQGPNGAPVSFYRGRVRVDTDAHKRHPQLSQSTLKPGMTATVDIRTGERSLLNYLLKPIAKSMSGAMTER